MGNEGSPQPNYAPFESGAGASTQKDVRTIYTDGKPPVTDFKDEYKNIYGLEYGQGELDKIPELLRIGRHGEKMPPNTVQRITREMIGQLVFKDYPITDTERVPQQFVRYINAEISPTLASDITFKSPSEALNYRKSPYEDKKTVDDSLYEFEKKYNKHPRSRTEIINNMDTLLHTMKLMKQDELAQDILGRAVGELVFMGKRMPTDEDAIVKAYQQYYNETPEEFIKSIQKSSNPEIFTPQQYSVIYYKMAKTLGEETTRNLPDYFHVWHTTYRANQHSKEKKATQSPSQSETPKLTEEQLRHQKEVTETIQNFYSKQKTGLSDGKMLAEKWQKFVQLAGRNGLGKNILPHDSSMLKSENLDPYKKAIESHYGSYQPNTSVIIEIGAHMGSEIVAQGYSIGDIRNSNGNINQKIITIYECLNKGQASPDEQARALHSISKLILKDLPNPTQRGDTPMEDGTTAMIRMRMLAVYLPTPYDNSAQAIENLFDKLDGNQKFEIAARIAAELTYHGVEVPSETKDLFNTYAQFMTVDGKEKLQHQTWQEMNPTDAQKTEREKEKEAKRIEATKREAEYNSYMTDLKAGAKGAVLDRNILPYAVLGAKFGETREEIRARYRPLAKLYHPDMPTTNVNFYRQINEAWAHIKKMHGWKN